MLVVRKSGGISLRGVGLEPAGWISTHGGESRIPILQDELQCSVPPMGPPAQPRVYPTGVVPASQWDNAPEVPSQPPNAAGPLIFGASRRWFQRSALPNPPHIPIFCLARSCGHPQPSDLNACIPSGLAILKQEIFSPNELHQCNSSGYCQWDRRFFCEKCSQWDG